MIAIPAIDLRGGACVQLVGGSYAHERIRLPDAVRVAREWLDIGFERLHVVDLDAAMGCGSNAPIIDAILREDGARVQVGGGVRSAERIEQLLAAGASEVVVGTRALEDDEWLADQASRNPGILMVATDVRAGQLAVRGWTETIDRDLLDTVGSLSALPLAGLLVTAVDVEGQMRGPALSLIESIVRASSVPVIASGGITTLDDLRALARLGVAAAVVGMALYTGTLNPRDVAEEFGA
jgi:phosphoribosylformimino-5-aminoimidazole carboxamide ribotide isomerase